MIYLSFFHLVFVCFRGETTFCPVKAIIPGSCGSNGSHDCLVEWNRRCGPSGLASNCSCDAANPDPANKPQHFCTCQVVCGTVCIS
ncbi:hypothetical protein U1Q18_030658 [Sarracenia purpurea var. burkii]